MKIVVVRSKSKKCFAKLDGAKPLSVACAVEVLNHSEVKYQCNECLRDTLSIRNHESGRKIVLYSLHKQRELDVCA